MVLGRQTPHATGYAMGIQRDGALGEDGTAVMAYFGDGASSEGDVHEAMVFASAYKAPVVFFCQNNQWAISVPSSVQTRIPLPAGQGLRLPRHPGGRQRRDRRPRRTRKALEQAREGKGPPDRGVHLPDRRAHHRRRPHQVPESAERRAWRAKDPLARLEKYLAGPASRTTLLRAVRGRGDELAEHVRARMPRPARTRTAGHLQRASTRKRTASSTEERAGFEEYQASFDAEAGREAAR